jgi:hypothetical protein
MPTTQATKVHARILETVAATSDDQMETTVAVDVLDKMGLLDTSMTTKVSLHPQWVLDHTSGPVALAIFAVNNCDNPLSLAAIAQRDKRVTLAAALLNNAHLPRTDHQNLKDTFPQLWNYGNNVYDQDDPEGNGNDVVDEDPDPELTPVPEKFYTPDFETFDATEPLYALPEYVPESVEAADVDDLIAKAMAVNAYATVRKIIHDYYDPVPVEDGKPLVPQPLWDLMSTHPADLIATLDQADRVRVLDGFVSALTQAFRWTWRVPAHRWDHRFVAALIDADRARQRSTPPTVTLQPYLTTKALRLVLRTRAWHSLAQMHRPNSHELKLIMKTLAPNELPMYGDPKNSSREVIATILAYKGPGAAPGAFTRRSLSEMSRIFNGPSDPLFQRVLDMADPSDLVSYVLDGEHFKEKRDQRPSAEQIPGLSQRINSDEGAVADIRSRDHSTSYETEEELVYAKALADNLLGAWEVLVGCGGISDVLISAIKNTGVPLPTMMARLSDGAELPVLTFPQVITALNQAQKV